MTSAVSERASQWFRRYRRVDRPRLRLVCFAHAGGGPTAFRTWHEGLPSDVEVLAVRYPGRHDRVTEPCVERMGPMAEAVVEALASVQDRPVALFGHSMGAWIAYEVAQRMSVPPCALVVSGQVPPSRRDSASPGSARRSDGGDFSDDDVLIAEVKRLGGYDARLFEDPDLRDLVLPPIRADFSLVRSYRPGPAAALRCPVLACFGADDVDTRPDDVRTWAGTTTGGYDERVFPGGHFYLTEQEPALLRELTIRLGTAVV
jgi:pyochelin biosynthetic protein PchC